MEHLRNFGGHETIDDSIAAQEFWLDENHQYVPDIAPEFSGVDGHDIYHPDWDKVVERVSMLYELVQLRKPLADGWDEHIALRDCPCGMTGAEWARWVAHRDGHSERNE